MPGEIEKTIVESDEAKPKQGGRRSFLLSAIFIGWCSFAGTVVAMSAALLRFAFPNVLFEKPQQFAAGVPEDYVDGQVSLRWKVAHGVWIVRDSGQIYALLASCTHLGCTPNWQEGDQKFKCPCHGSGFHLSGINFEGPAPRPLERCAIELSPDGQLVVDKNKRFLYEKGGWSDPVSYVQL